MTVRNQTHDYYLSQPTSSPPPLLNSSPPQLRRSLVPPVDKIPPPLLNSTAFGRPKCPPPCSWAAQVDKTPPPLLNFTTLWRPKWKKYLLPSSTSPLSGAPSVALRRPKCRSLAPLVALLSSAL